MQRGGSAIKSLLPIAALLVSAFTAIGGSRTDACTVERQPFAKAACLELIYDQGVLGMAQDISHVLTRLQAATAAELISLQRQYDIAQSRWNQQVAHACWIRHRADAPGFQTCRIAALRTREDQLALSLDRAARDFGAPAEYEIPIPDQFEVLIPLPNDFGVDARLPLLLPTGID